MYRSDASDVFTIFRESATSQSGNYNTTGYIRGDGTIQNASYTTTGYAKGVKGMGSGGVFLLSV
jgi:hypothetical protein